MSRGQQKITRKVSAFLVISFGSSVNIIPLKCTIQYVYDHLVMR